jgi:hypothetical protein
MDLLHGEEDWGGGKGGALWNEDMRVYVHECARTLHRCKQKGAHDLRKLNAIHGVQMYPSRSMTIAQAE